MLRDGYHRAVGLLARGISVVPALVKEFDSIDRHFRKNMLPSEAYLGRHAPLLPDYLDDAVSAAVDLPAMRRFIMIRHRSSRWTEATPLQTLSELMLLGAFSFDANGGLAKLDFCRAPTDRGSGRGLLPRVTKRRALGPPFRQIELR